MLQSRQADEVFEILLGGVTEGYGFPGSLIGKVSVDGISCSGGKPIPFRGVRSGSRCGTPAPFWRGHSGPGPFPRVPQELPHLPERVDPRFFPVLCLPVMRNPKVRCAEAKNCSDRTCPTTFRKPEVLVEPDSRGVPHRRGSPEIHRERSSACLRCEVFPSAALLVVRSGENGRLVNRENAVPISNLVSEAGLALEVVSLYDNMKIMA